ncbi:unnamed protein product [Bursaphelenchus xylophilus]|uniref:Receptor expression-enhancing protein n=1 Tax=Bursaphelenchus xylophilus TaxID=6326 RepID=A0A1I7RSJ8_BURXY|nr:unnamed protein product [Bursaphelenchus xylophilus]CAG9122895.1 unnamed protein product [Bursaphelenchus xylophilus]
MSYLKSLISSSSSTQGSIKSAIPDTRPPAESLGIKDIHPLLIKFLYKNENKKLTEFFEKLEKKTQTNRENLSYIIIGMLSCYVAFGHQREMVSDLIGFIFPFHLTITVLRNPNIKEEHSLMVYWAVFGLCQVMDNFFRDMVPAYYLFKTVLYVYLLVPGTGGIHYVEKGLLIKAGELMHGFFELFVSQ